MDTFEEPNALTPGADSPGQRLLAWYDRVRRDLPWRRSRDPYAIWVSEIMLQQTQVKKVVPYFEAFMRRFGTLETLAAAEIDEVLAAWSGLGYYRRARQLHRAAQQLADAGQSMPTTAAELQQLPGIGPYTSAAIASIAFGEAVPVLDGNVERVMARRLAWADDAKKAASRRRFLTELEKLLDPERPGDSNQALMELGATVCRPKNPSCLLCPLSEGCLGKLRPEDYPPPRRRRATEQVSIAVAVVEDEDRYLFFKRSAKAGLMAGMWELPWVETDTDLSSALASRYGGRWILGEAVGSVSHGITHRAITASIYPSRFEAGNTVAEGPEAAWLTRGELEDRATSSLVHKVLAGI